VTAAIRPAGDCGALLDVPDNAAAVRLARLLREERPELTEVVAGHTTVLVVWRAGSQLSDLSELVERALLPEPEVVGRLVEIPVAYDGPDLDHVARSTGLSREEVVSRHTAVEHRVAFLGFQPGFAYLIGGDEQLFVPRRDSPRTRVPGGTVAIAGPYSGVYPRDSPGGWQLLGTTTIAMFDPDRPDPALLAPGDRVRFVAA
jgi:KipI family sensor histidine kinase inhibitor